MPLTEQREGNFGAGATAQPLAQFSEPSQQKSTFPEVDSNQPITGDYSGGLATTFPVRSEYAHEESLPTAEPESVTEPQTTSQTTSQPQTDDLNGSQPVGPLSQEDLVRQQRDLDETAKEDVEKKSVKTKIMDTFHNIKAKLHHDKDSNDQNLAEGEQAKRRDSSSSLSSSDMEGYSYRQPLPADQITQERFTMIAKDAAKSAKKHGFGKGPSASQRLKKKLGLVKHPRDQVEGQYRRHSYNSSDSDVESGPYRMPAQYNTPFAGAAGVESGDYVPEASSSYAAIPAATQNEEVIHSENRDLGTEPSSWQSSQQQPIQQEGPSQLSENLSTISLKSSDSQTPLDKTVFDRNDPLRQEIHGTHGAHSSHVMHAEQAQAHVQAEAESNATDLNTQSSSDNFNKLERHRGVLEPSEQQFDEAGQILPQKKSGNSLNSSIKSSSSGSQEEFMARMDCKINSHVPASESFAKSYSSSGDSLPGGSTPVSSFSPPITDFLQNDEHRPSYVAADQSQAADSSVNFNKLNDLSYGQDAGASNQENLPPSFTAAEKLM